MCLPYSAKFSRHIIFTVFTDSSQTVKCFEKWAWPSRIVDPRNLFLRMFQKTNPREFSSSRNLVLYSSCTVTRILCEHCNTFECKGICTVLKTSQVPFRGGTVSGEAGSSGEGGVKAQCCAGRTPLSGQEYREVTWS